MRTFGDDIAPEPCWHRADGCHGDGVRAERPRLGFRICPESNREPLTADDVMPAREVAELLRAPVLTVEDWARGGILPSVKIGKRRLYIRQNIEAVLKGQPKAAS